MTDLEQINKIFIDIQNLMDTARPNFGEEGYNALNEAAESVRKAWYICKRGQEEKLKNAYHTPVNNSRKPIKSSLEDRLVPYLEEFEEGYADAITRDSEDADEFNHVYEDTFFERFKSDYNLTDTDIRKLDKAVREIWDASSTEEGEIRDMSEMYGAPRGATPEEALKHFE